MKKPEDLFKREIHKGNTSSIRYFYFSKDSIIYSYKDGYADVSLRRAVDFNTTYNAFSVTKTFTALAIMQLAEKGLLDINKPVVHYLADFPYGDSITIKHLLSHIGGLPNLIPLA